MQEEINNVIEQGYKPILFIDTSLATSTPTVSEEIRSIARRARTLPIQIVYSDKIDNLMRVSKAYVFRYGSIDRILEAAIKRKGGKIVSGNFKVPA